MDPNPFKHPAIVLARVRRAIEPSLLAAGFQFNERNKPNKPIYLYVDYSRPSELFRLSWDRQDSNRFLGLKAEILDQPNGCKTIAATDLSLPATFPRNRVTGEIQMRIDSFVEAVNAFLNGLPRSTFSTET